jgi:plasmid stabilization system protein ParE
MNLLVAAPHRWPAGEHGSRKFVLRRFPFAIFYREKQAVIHVLAIAHGHRRPGYWKDRL